MALRQVEMSLEAALHCAKCNVKAPYVEECSDPAFSPGEVVLVACRSPNCEEKKDWFYCKSCRKRNYKHSFNSLLQHSRRKKHMERHAAAYPPPPVQPPDPPAGNTHPPNEALANVFNQPINDESNLSPMKELDNVAVNEIAMLDTAEFSEAMDRDLAATHIENATSSMEVTATTGTNSHTCNFPRINLTGQEWLQDALKATP